jgi:hypothetical protein
LEAPLSIGRSPSILGDVKVAKRWAGMLDITAGRHPGVFPIEALPGLYLATGFSGHGFGIAAAARLARIPSRATRPSIGPSHFAIPE